jgi:hypothetical protein
MILSGQVLGDAYAYGHLVTSAFSMTIAAAFAVLALRVRALRADLAYAAVALLCTATGLAAMLLALRPALGHARLLFGIAIALYASVPVLWHIQFAADVLPPPARRRRARLLAGYAGSGAACLALVASGALDGGRFRVLEVGPLRSGLMVLPWWAAGGLFLFALAIIPLSAPLLVAGGPRRLERRSALPIMLIAPPLCAHELLVATGALDMVPLGGLVVGLASFQGVVILAERFRALTERRRLGRYRIERRIGSGGIADVFQARRAAGGPLEGVEQPVALKRLRPELAADPGEARRLIEEARILARLSHPNIVALYDAGCEEGELFLALELVDGTSLARLLASARRAGSPLGAPAAAAIGAEAAGALGYAHTFADPDGRPAGLIHRDVTPHNLLLDRRGTVKLADFGIARPAGPAAATATGGLRGKLPYVAPEQLRGQRYDHRIDIHALGVVLFEVACGALPYDGESEAEIVLRLLEGRPRSLDLLRAAGQELAGLIERMIAPDPADRPGDAAALGRALAALGDERAARSRLADLVGEDMAARAEQERARRPTTRLLARPSAPR